MVMAVLKFVEERERRWKEEEEEERFAWQLASQAITAPPLPSQASVRFGKRKRHTHTLPLTFKREGKGGGRWRRGGESPPRGFGLCVRVCTTCVRRVCGVCTFPLFPMHDDDDDDGTLAKTAAVRSLPRSFLLLLELLPWVSVVVVFFSRNGRGRDVISKESERGRREGESLPSSNAKPTTVMIVWSPLPLPQKRRRVIYEMWPSLNQRRTRGGGERCHLYCCLSAKPIFFLLLPPFPRKS